MGQINANFVVTLSCVGHPRYNHLRHGSVPILSPAARWQTSNLQEMLTAAGNLTHFDCAVLSQVE